MSRFDYVKYDEIAINAQKSLKEACSDLDEVIESELFDGRAKSLALTHLEISYMWIGKAIRDDQIARGGDVSDVVERSDV